MRLFFLFAIIVLPISSFPADNVCFFRPPDGWVAADPSVLSPLVKMGFIGPPSQLGFCPSLNLAEEKVNCSLKVYLEAVKKIHTSNRHKEWSYLGSFTTLAGEGALTQIDMTSQSGPMRLLQLILIKENTAYILTGACLKKEYLQQLSTFRNAFHSLDIATDLFTAVKDEKKRKDAKCLYSAAENAVRDQKAFSTEMPAWQDFQNFMIEEFAELGPYWQALAIADAYRRLQAIPFPTENWGVQPEVPNGTRVPDLHFYLKPLYHILSGNIENAWSFYEKMDCFRDCCHDDCEQLPYLR
jgi:hypothetical protein